MAPKSPRHGLFSTPARRRSATFFRPRLEWLEGRVVPALFNVQTPLASSLLKNNGCVVVGDLNKDGYADAVFTNYGPSTGSNQGNAISVVYGGLASTGSRP